MKLKKYDSALVIGKFMPMHKGHKALIDFAAHTAESVSVFVLGCPTEPIPLDLRTEWVRKTYRNAFGLPTTDTPIDIFAVEYDDTKLNSSSESDLQSSIEWSEFLREMIKNQEIDVIIGSEKYVQYMAEYLGLNYVIYDEDRTKLNISATAIKNDIISNWDYLVPSVKRFYAKHVCICGSESTGKTTVATNLEKKYPYVTMIPELGRCFVGNAKTCTLQTLDTTLFLHGKILNQVIFDPPTPIVVWDTDNYTTLSYISWLFKVKTSHPIQNKLADKYFFFDSTIPYEKDATRIEKEESIMLKENHIQTLKEHHISFEMVQEDREKTVDQWVSTQIKEIINKLSV